MCRTTIVIRTLCVIAFALVGLLTVLAVVADTSSACDGTARTASANARQ
ncbi:hypothetical protein [Paraburkholderia acidicola]|uniref:Uncharacterized protein n=1 Tax=Paraburkholderia acidicola TaxID=1912599 RepID=A0ABV1LME3_9BURK|nr:hypothetical protein [Paraburkholderia acidicola]